MEISPRSGGRRPWTCFNGATAFRRWRSVRFHRAAVVDRQLQWGHRLSAMEIRPLSPGRRGRQAASMGPPPFGDGDPSAFTGPPWSTGSFNGATAFRRWRSVRFHRAAVVDRQLQWGHRLSAMEICGGWCSPSSRGPSFNGATAFRRWRYVGAGVPPHRGGLASMGPPPFGDGDWPPSQRVYAVMRWLQWGHRLSVMEISPAARAAPPTGRSFNGATAFRRWRFSTVAGLMPIEQVGFNGATAFRRWR